MPQKASETPIPIHTTDKGVDGGNYGSPTAQTSQVYEPVIDGQLGLDALKLLGGRSVSAEIAARGGNPHLRDNGTPWDISRG